MAATVPQTEENLLAYFQPGDVPTAEQFEELISTMFYIVAQAAAVPDAIKVVCDAELTLLHNNSSAPTASLVENRMTGGTIEYECTMDHDGDHSNYTVATVVITITPDATWPDAFYPVPLDSGASVRLSGSGSLYPLSSYQYTRTKNEDAYIYTIVYEMSETTSMQIKHTIQFVALP